MPVQEIQASGLLDPPGTLKNPASHTSTLDVVVLVHVGMPEYPGTGVHDEHEASLVAVQKRLANVPGGHEEQGLHSSPLGVEILKKFVWHVVHRLELLELAQVVKGQFAIGAQEVHWVL